MAKTAKTINVTHPALRMSTPWENNQKCYPLAPSLSISAALKPLHREPPLGRHETAVDRQGIAPRKAVELNGFFEFERRLLSAPAPG
jgi:hypothetical protein